MELTTVPRRLLVRGLPIGFAVGVCSGLFGIGGGALLIVGLLWLGFTQHEAHATSLAAIILTAAAALVPYAARGEVSWVPALLLTLGAATGAYAGAGLMHRLPERTLRIVFVIFLIFVAARMLIGVDTGEGVEQANVAMLAGFGLLGLVTGVLSAVMGIGGGLILVPALVLLFGFTQHGAEATSLAVVVPTALVGAWRHTRGGYTAWRTGLVLGLGGIVGGVAGALLALYLGGITLQRLFAAFLLIMALRLAFRQR